jgi:hypothetical protein
MSKIPTNQKPGGAVNKQAVTPKTARVHKPDRMGLSPNGGSSSRGKGQK